LLKPPAPNDDPEFSGAAVVPGLLGPLDNDDGPVPIELPLVPEVPEEFPPVAGERRGRPKLWLPAEGVPDAWVPPGPAAIKAFVVARAKPIATNDAVVV
jgi:hypothetical protein